MKQTADDNQYIARLEIVDTWQGDSTIIVPLPWGYRRMTARFYEPWGYPTIIARVYDHFWAKMTI